MTTPSGAPAVLLYDGTCGFCAASVRFVLDREPAARAAAPDALRFATLQGALGEAARARHPWLADVDSVVWVEGERVLVRSEAALRVLAYLGGPWAALAAVGRVVPRALRDLVYDRVARVRYRIAGRLAANCLLPTPAERARFLDDRAPSVPHAVPAGLPQTAGR